MREKSGEILLLTDTSAFGKVPRFPAKNRKVSRTRRCVRARPDRGIGEKVWKYRLYLEKTFPSFFPHSIFKMRELGKSGEILHLSKLPWIVHFCSNFWSFLLKLYYLLSTFVWIALLPLSLHSAHTEVVLLLFLLRRTNLPCLSSFWFGSFLVGWNLF